MARITVEDCLVEENNRFSLVMLASQRAKQLMHGDTPLIKSKNKVIVTALREIAAGKVRFSQSSDEAIEAWLHKSDNNEELVHDIEALRLE